MYMRHLNTKTILRDLTDGMDVVFDVKHKYLTNDIDNLINFNVKVLPKSWTDEYGDLITTSSMSLASCLQVLLNTDGLIQ